MALFGTIGGFRLLDNHSLIEPFTFVISTPTHLCGRAEIRPTIGGEIFIGPTLLGNCSIRPEFGGVIDVNAGECE